MSPAPDKTLLQKVYDGRFGDCNELLVGALESLIKTIEHSRIPRNGGNDYYYSAPSIDREVARARRAILANKGEPEAALDDLARTLTAATTINYPGETQ